MDVDVANKLYEGENSERSTELQRTNHAEEATIEEMKNKSKDSSMEEDLLGTNTLLMSDSDDDCAANKSVTPKKPSPEAETIAIQTSNDLQNNEILQEEHKIIQKKKKFSTILDSESEDDEPVKETVPANIPRAKISALIDTDSESENEEGKQSAPQVQQKKFHKPKIIDSDSENTEENDITELRKKKRVTKKDKINDSSSESNLSDQNDEKGDEDEMENDGQVVEGDHNQGKSKPMRASAKKALDDMQAIQSEQQRLCREAHLSVPYHKPKRRTLEEFLKRRTIIRPAGESNCSPASALVQKKSLKMTQKELEEYAKLMEERAKEATEFFKSESESEEEQLKDNVGVLDTIEGVENPNEEVLTAISAPQEGKQEITELPKTQTTYEEEEQSEHNVEMPPATDGGVECPNEMELNENKFTQEKNNEEMSVTENNNTEQMNDQAMEVDTESLVTEVVELPKLDLSSFHINENDETPSTSHCKIDTVKNHILNEHIFKESPKLQGNAGTMIVLENEDSVTSRPTGADNLLQRLLNTQKARKAKTSETVNILSNVDGKLEITKVDVHLHDADAPNMEQKPGAAYFKLKENLKSLIKKKRLKEMQRKLDDVDEYNKCLEIDGDECDGNSEQEEEDENEYEIEGDEKVKKPKEKSKFSEIVIDDEENAIPIDEYEDEVETEEEEEVEEEQNDDELNESGNEFVDNEAEVEDEPQEDNDESSSESEVDVKSESKESSSLPTTQRKNRIIKAFACDSDVEDEDDLELLKTQPPQASSNVSTTIFGGIDSPAKSSGFNIHTDLDKGIADTQELLDLCSGAFERTQKAVKATNEAIISQIPVTQRLEENEVRAELLDLCSGTFEESNGSQSQVRTVTNVVANTEINLSPSKPLPAKPAAYKILSSDEEEDAWAGGASEADAKNRVKRLRKKLRKGQTKLGFSDDEEEEEGLKQIDAASIKMTETVDDDDVPETYIEYDSEENEIVVQMSKKDCIKRAEKFLEDEAELSESDWGSADEDEKQMDYYDIELGDEDNFDRAELQQELGQIHARKMLDEDIREVRKIKEMLFEDEENDGVGRQRQFRWKNIENGFSLDVTNRSGKGDEGGSGESGDEDQKQENLWRKIRFEREQLLKEKGLKESSQELPASVLSPNVPLAAILANNTVKCKNNTSPLSAGKRLQIIAKKSKSGTSKQNGSPFLISLNATAKAPAITPNTTPTSTSILQPKAARGSFLMRDKETLTKFANLTKSISTPGYDDSEAAGLVSSKAMKSKNFVFATLTKEEHEHMKRKADDLMSSSSEYGTNFMKKPRPNTQSDKQCLIDQLL